MFNLEYKTKAGVDLHVHSIHEIPSTFPLNKMSNMSTYVVDSNSLLVSSMETCENPCS